MRDMKNFKSRKADDRVFIVSLIIFGLGLTVFGLLLEIQSVRQLSGAKEHSSWLTTEGRVISSRVGTYGTVEERSYKAEVVYGYSVDGTNYSAESISAEDNRHNDYFTAAQIVNHYPEGQRVTVYYQPDNPAVTLLEPAKRTYVVMVAVIFCVAAGLFILIFGIVKYQGLSGRPSKPPHSR
jgi:hypothetical protein